MKHRITLTAALLLVLTIAPAASASPPGGFSAESESVGAELQIDGGYLFVSADNYSENYPEGSFEGSNTYLDFGVETETGFVYCFAYGEGGPTIDSKLAAATVAAQIEGECFVEEPPHEEGEAGLSHEENEEHEEPSGIPFTAAVDMTWSGTGNLLRSSGHSTGPSDVCKDNSQWRDAATTGSITLFAEGVVDTTISPAESNWASISRWSYSCHAKGSPGAP